jgi:hypothetical protein
MKVVLGILLAHGFPVPAPFVISYSHLLQSLLQGTYNAMLPEDRRVTSARALFGQDFPIDHARNRLCKLFLDEDDGDYLLFLDADMTHPPDLIHRLVRHDVDVVTARYVIRKPPFFSVAMRKVGDGATEYQAIEKVEPVVRGLMPIDAGGAGALLISRRCLEAVRARIGEDWFRYQDGPDGLRSRSEDMWFYEQAIAAGFQPYLDADLRCGHIASMVVDDRNYAPYDEAHRDAIRRAAHQPEEVTT